MSSQGAGANISAEDAIDLLQRLITESIKIQAMFVGRGSVTAALRGFVSWQSDGVVQITERLDVNSASLCFGIRDVVAFTYGDDRAFGGTVIGPRLTSGLCFLYPDGAQVALFEMEVFF